MEVLHERCCGLDVHQAVIVACMRTSQAGKKTKKQIREFSTVAAGLRQLAEWLVAEGCTAVAMESTGVYWMPIYEALEGRMQVIVANAEHIRHVPGRKTDVKDSEWIADLLQHGLLRPSFVPQKQFRELRRLTRMRRGVVQDGSTQRNRVLKLLEQYDVKLSTFMSDVFGTSGRLMLDALVEGNRPATEIAGLAKGTLRKKKADLELALDAPLTEQQRFILKAQYGRVQHAESVVASLDNAIREHLAPYRDVLELLTTAPGIDCIVSAEVIAELGTDVTSFRSGAALSSWIGVCPGNNESAGKRKSGRTNAGNVFLKSSLVEAAWGAIRAPGYLREKYYSLRARRGPKKALMAIAHKLAIVIYQILRDRKPYRDLGVGYLNGLQRRSKTRRLVERLQAFGYDVALTPREPAVPPEHAAAEPKAPSDAARSARNSARKPKKEPNTRVYVLRSSGTPAAAAAAELTPALGPAPKSPSRRRAKRAT